MSEFTNHCKLAMDAMLGIYARFEDLNKASILVDAHIKELKAQLREVANANSGCEMNEKDFLQLCKEVSDAGLARHDYQKHVRKMLRYNTPTLFSMRFHVGKLGSSFKKLEEDRDCIQRLIEDLMTSAKEEFLPWDDHPYVHEPMEA
jgi:hypothetical protein